MNANKFSRRKFLKLSSISAFSAMTLCLSGYSLAGQKWELMTRNLTKNEGQLLLQLCKRIYPHPSLEDFFYGACVESIDSKLSGERLQIFRNGLATLSNVKYSELSTQEQDAILKRIEKESFFQTVRSDMVVSLYNNPKIWERLGYEGASFSKGGYINRGFNDIAWLPKVSKERVNG